MTTVFVEIEDMSLWLHSNQFLWFYSIWKHENVQVSLYKLTTNGNYMHRHNWQFWNTAWGELVSSSSIEGHHSLTQWLNGCKFRSFPPLKLLTFYFENICSELKLTLLWTSDIFITADDNWKVESNKQIYLCTLQGHRWNGRSLV